MDGNIVLYFGPLQLVHQVAGNELNRLIQVESAHRPGCLTFGHLLTMSHNYGRNTHAPKTVAYHNKTWQEQLHRSNCHLVKWRDEASREAAQRIA